MNFLNRAPETLYAADARRFAPGRNWIYPPDHRDAFEGLDNVALLEVLKAFEGETAFITGGHLTHVVLKTLEAGELAFVHYHLIA
jgi:hypothetical protein